MGSEGVVEGLNICEDGDMGSAVGREPVEVNHFTLEAAKEVLGNRVVVGGPFAGHALPNAILRK